MTEDFCSACVGLFWAIHGRMPLMILFLAIRFAVVTDFKEFMVFVTSEDAYRPSVM